MAYLQKLLPQPMQSLAHGSISSSYATLGTITHDARIVKVVNNTDGDMIISWDGLLSTAGNDFIPANSFCLYDVTANKVQEDGCFISNGTVFSVKYSSSPSKNSVYLVVLYTLVR